jgi:hypothetical protein
LEFGSTVVPTTGATAFKLTTWFLAPTDLPAGKYSLVLSDGTRSATTTITVKPAIALSETIGLKGDRETIEPALYLPLPIGNTYVPTTATNPGNGFAANSPISVSFNGVVVVPTSLGFITSATGSLFSAAPSFYIPATAVVGTNTVTVTDAAGNTASTTFTLLPPSLITVPTSGPTGTALEVIGSGYAVSSEVIITVGGQLVTITPTPLTTSISGGFVGFATVPSGLTGNVTVTATDSDNDVASATFTVTTVSVTGPINTAELSSTSQTLNSAGAAASSFAPGATVKLSFDIQTSSGSGPIVWAITFQQGTTVFNIVNVPATITTTTPAQTYSQLIPATAPAGTWTATIQVYASNGVTPLAVYPLTFTVT